MSFAEFSPATQDGDSRRAGRDALSLALMAARNHTLAWINAYAEAIGDPLMGVPYAETLNPPLWEAGHVGWYQEAWIARNVQRHRGSSADPTRTRLASVEPQADAWYDEAQVPHRTRWGLELPGLEATRQYLGDTLEVTLELLSHAGEDDDALYFYRLALLHEDRHAESFATMAQTLGLQTGLVAEPPPLAARGPVRLPATRWRLGSEPGHGFVFDNEKWAHEIAVPEFEIDAQPVSWAQYADFIADGGYDEERWWSPAGWAWLQASGRRAPRHVEQVGSGVLQRRFGHLLRVPSGRSATHVNAHEAQAWCRWAGRRLPTEVEWEAAAHLGAARGFRWGEVWEWTASRFEPYPGWSPDPDREWSQPAFGSHQVLRGASFATAARLRHPRLRHFARPERDDGFHGFRSCSV